MVNLSNINNTSVGFLFYFSFFFHSLSINIHFLYLGFTPLVVYNGTLKYTIYKTTFKLRFFPNISFIL